MSDLSDKERLLADILAEESDPALRETLLDQTLRLARRRRYYRGMRKGGVTLAILFSLGLLGWHYLVPGPTPATPSMTSRPYTLINTQPLAHNAIVSSKPFPLLETVVSVSSAPMVTTSTARQSFPELNDDQLLALVPSIPVLIVRDAPDTAQLVFASPEDRDLFLRD